MDNNHRSPYPQQIIPRQVLPEMLEKNAIAGNLCYKDHVEREIVLHHAHLFYLIDIP